MTKADRATERIDDCWIEFGPLAQAGQ